MLDPRITAIMHFVLFSHSHMHTHTKLHSEPFAKTGVLHTFDLSKRKSQNNGVSASIPPGSLLSSSSVNGFQVSKTSVQEARIMRVSKLKMK